MHSIAIAPAAAVLAATQITAASVAGSASGDDSSFRLDRSFQPDDRAAVTDPLEPLDSGELARLSFEDRAKWRLGVVGGAAVDLEDDDSATDTHLAFVAYYRLAPRWDVVFQLDGSYSNQTGDNTFALGPSFTFRWHFYERGRWTLYTDAGIGFVLSPDDLPDGGTSFNFTPRAGAGLTYRLLDNGTRLYAGVRWHHFSNAQITGDDDNPDRDGIMGYAGVSFPF
ncbi:MAG: acyloxyacyl hydrolase [Planctomycetota bacterium]